MKLSLPKAYRDTSNSNTTKGFVLLDVVFALSLFILGFIALYGLTESALREAQQVLTLTEAANQAQNLMEELSAYSWEENLNAGRCIPGEAVEGQKGCFQWKVSSDWDIPNQLLEVQVEVFWREKGRTQQYILDTLFEVTD